MLAHEKTQIQNLKPNRNHYLEEPVWKKVIELMRNELLVLTHGGGFAPTLPPGNTQ